MNKKNVGTYCVTCYKNVDQWANEDDCFHQRDFTKEEQLLYNKTTHLMFDNIE